MYYLIDKSGVTVAFNLKAVSLSKHIKILKIKVKKAKLRKSSAGD